MPCAGGDSSYGVGFDIRKGGSSGGGSLLKRRSADSARIDTGEVAYEWPATPTPPSPANSVAGVTADRDVEPKSMALLVLALVRDGTVETWRSEVDDGAPAARRSSNWLDSRAATGDGRLDWLSARGRSMTPDAFRGDR